MVKPSWCFSATCKTEHASATYAAPLTALLTSEMVFSSAILSPSTWRSRAFSIRSWALPCSDAASLLSALLALATAVPAGQGLTLSISEMQHQIGVRGAEPCKWTRRG